MAGTNEQPTTPDPPNPLENCEGTLPAPILPEPGPMPRIERRNKDEPRPTPLFPEARINGRDAQCYTRPRRHNEGYYPVHAKDVPGLDSTALEPVEPPPKVVLRAWEKLGYSDKEWSKAGAMAAQEFGRYLTMKITGRFLLTKGFNTIAQVEMAMKWAREILESQHKDVEMSHKVAAAQLIPLLARAFYDLSGRMMDLAEKSADKSSTERKRNLPPMFGVQVNVAGVTPSPAPATPATSGSCPESEPVE